MQLFESRDRPNCDDLVYPSIVKMAPTYPSFEIEEIDPSSEEAQAIRGNIESLQREITETITEDITGLNLKAVLAYMKRRNLRVEPFHVVSADDLAYASDRLQRSWVTMLADVHGLYSPYIRMSLIKRDHAREALLGHQTTMRVIAHELVHSSSEHDRIEFSGDTSEEIILNAQMPRIGARYMPYAPAGHLEHNNVVTGALAEEATAELDASNFIDETYTRYFNDPGVGFTFEFEDEHIWLPARYVDHAPIGGDTFNVSYNTPALAARAFDIFNMIDEDHRIIWLLQKGRRDATAFLELDQRLDAMGVADLARTMSETVYSVPGFVAALAIAEFVAKENGIATRPDQLRMPDIDPLLARARSDKAVNLIDSVPSKVYTLEPTSL